MADVFTSILCPVDFSEHSDRALVVASELAALTGAHLNIVTVVDAFLAAAAQASGSGETLHTQTQDELDQMFGRLKAERPIREPAGVAIAVGDPADQILKQAADCKADLIIMGTQGLGAAQRFVFGSTTEKVLRQSAVPVLAVPAGAPA